MLRLDTQDYSAARESRSSPMNVTIEKEEAKKKNSNKSPRRRINKNIAKKLAKYNDKNSHKPSIHSNSESTCETLGVSMNCSLDFSSADIETSSATESKSLSGHMASSKSDCGPRLGASLMPTDCKTSEYATECNEDDAIYYFGYGPIVNHFVRIRRDVNTPAEDIRTAILYDHRLQFVPGGTANIVPKIGWDVKGVILKFKTQQEWETFRQFDASYEVRPVSVSVIDKMNLDPKKKNDHTAPFEVLNGDEDDYGDDEEDEDYNYGFPNDDGDDQQQELDESERSAPLMRSHRLHKSCLVTNGANSSLNNLDTDSSEEEDYSCPFSFEPKSKKADPDAVKCYTFSMDWNAPKNGRTGQALIGKPQERYLKLMTDGLRYHEIDETYIRDEILSVDYIPNERDKVSDLNSFLSFPNAKKVSNVSQQKYETKLCGEPKSSKDVNATHFIIGTKIIRVDGENLQLNNPCVKWLRKQAHGKGDITLLVHQTFVDKDQPLHIPLLNSSDDVTEQHQKWAEHVVYLYLERGGLTATTVGELVADNGDGGKTFPSFKTKMPGNLKGLFKKGSKAPHKVQRAFFPKPDAQLSVSSRHADGSVSAFFRVETEQQPPPQESVKKSRFGMGRFQKK